MFPQNAKAMEGLSLLGAERPTELERPQFWPSTMLSIGSGLVGAMAWRAHPVLAFLNASAVASNVHGVASKQIEPADAATQIGRHALATAAALAVPSHPAAAFTATMLATYLLLRRKPERADKKGAPAPGARPISRPPEIIDVVPLEADARDQALVRIKGGHR